MMGGKTILVNSLRVLLLSFRKGGHVRTGYIVSVTERIVNREKICFWWKAYTNHAKSVQSASYTFHMSRVSGCFSLCIILWDFLQKALPDVLTLSIVCLPSSREAASRYSSREAASNFSEQNSIIYALFWPLTCLNSPSRYCSSAFLLYPDVSTLSRHCHCLEMFLLSFSGCSLV